MRWEERKAVAEHLIHCYHEKLLITCALGMEEALYVSSAYSCMIHNEYLGGTGEGGRNKREG